MLQNAERVESCRELRVAADAESCSDARESCCRQVRERFESTIAADEREIAAGELRNCFRDASGCESAHVSQYLATRSTIFLPQDFFVFHFFTL